MTRAANRLCDTLLAVVGGSGTCRGSEADVDTWSQSRACGMAHAHGAANRRQSPRRELISKRSERTASALTDEIWAALGAQTVTVVAQGTWGETIGDLAGDLDRIVAQHERLEADIEETFLEHPPEQVINTMCGFRPRTRGRTLAEIGDPHRFVNPARLVAYAGPAPVDRQSGRSHTTARSRRGNHHIKNAMFIATQQTPTPRPRSSA